MDKDIENMLVTIKIRVHRKTESKGQPEELYKVKLR